MDILSFRRIDASIRNNAECIECTDEDAYVEIIINGRTYIDIMEPYSRRAGCGAGYVYKKHEMIYEPTATLYDNLFNVVFGIPKNDEDGNIVDLIIRVGVFDACAPECAIIETEDDKVIWKSHCYYNSWWPEGGLPVFTFSIKQYAESLDQLKMIIETHS